MVTLKQKYTLILQEKAGELFCVCCFGTKQAVMWQTLGFAVESKHCFVAYA